MNNLKQFLDELDEAVFNIREILDKYDLVEQEFGREKVFKALSIKLAKAEQNIVSLYQALHVSHEKHDELRNNTDMI
jgi:hypothetical protein